MLIILLWFLLLTMLMINEDVLWLEPLFIDNNNSMAQTTFGYQPSSNISSSPMTTVLANQNRLLILKWSVRIIGGLLIIVGGIGNTLSALTLSRKKLRAQVTSIYLIALALSDLGKYIISIGIIITLACFR